MTTAARLRPRTDAGVSMTEMLIVLVALTSLAAVTSGLLGNASATIQGDADMRVVEGQIKFAREAAINQRRAMELQFSGNVVQVVRRNIPNGTTVISQATMEHHAVFMLFTGQPDTPDTFGRATAVDFGGNPVMFSADGMLTVANGTPINGSIFIGQPGRPMTSRAITIFGPTATIRTYRWSGSQWRR